MKAINIRKPFNKKKIDLKDVLKILKKIFRQNF